MDAYSEPRVRLEPAVAEEWLRRVVMAGHSPNDFASWVLSTVDLDELLHRFAASEGSGPPAEEPTVPERGGPSPQGPASAGARALGVVGERNGVGVVRWTKESFFALLDLVSSVDDMVGSVRLLGAYLRLGPIPSSQDLKAICGFEDEGEWQTALRVAKQRLTIQARRMGSPPLFRRAKAGKDEGQRLHPIEPLLFGWLKEWGKEKATTGRPEDAFPDPERWGWNASHEANKENDA